MKIESLRLADGEVTTRKEICKGMEWRPLSGTIYKISRKEFSESRALGLVGNIRRSRSMGALHCYLTKSEQTWSGAAAQQIADDGRGKFERSMLEGPDDQILKISMYWKQDDHTVYIRGSLQEVKDVLTAAKVMLE